MWRLPLFFLGLLCSIHSFGQNVSLTGVVMDSTNREPLMGAHLILIHQFQSIQYAQTSNIEGSFNFKNIKSGNYWLTISYMGFNTYNHPLIVSNTPVNLGNIYLSKANINLDEVQVTDVVPMSVQKGDTLQFNARAFKTNPDAYAEDLIGKMPGMVVENGSVKAQGEEVKKVLVDGKKYFDEDPMIALKNIPAEVIDKIEVFDEHSEQNKLTGFDDGQSVRAINIVTDHSLRVSQFGEVYAGYGYPGKYSAGGNVNIFNNDKRISVIGLSNNINQQNFSMQDLLGVITNEGGMPGMGPGSGVGPPGGGDQGTPPGGPGLPGNNFIVSPQSGISKTQSIGLNYSDSLGRHINISTSYFFNYSDNHSNQKVNQQYFLSDGGDHYYKELNNSGSQNMNHRLNLRLEYVMDTLNTLIFSPRLYFQGNKSSSDIAGQSMNGTIVARSTKSYNTTDLTGYNLSGDLMYMHRSKKKGRTASINMRSGLNQKKGDDSQESYEFYTDGNIEYIDSLEQHADIYSDGSTISSRLVFTEPLNKNGLLQFNYSNSFTGNYSDQQTFIPDTLTRQFSLLDTALSNKFKKQYSSHSVGTGYLYRSKNLFVTAGFDYQYASLRSEQQFPEKYGLKQSFYSILPQARMNINFTSFQRLQLIYRSLASSPSIKQLQNVVNDENPLQLSVGNENLKQEIDHNILLRFTLKNITGSSILMLLVSADFTRNYIGNNTLIANKDTLIGKDFRLKKGTILIQPVNIDGYRDFRFFTTCGIPLKSLRCNLNLQASYGLTREPGIINGAENFSNNHSFAVNIMLSSNISQNLDFSFSSRSTVNNTVNSIQKELNEKYIKQNTMLQFYSMCWKGLVIQAQLSHEFYHGLSAGYDQNYFICNLSLGKKIFNNQRGEIRLSANDLFNQSKNLQRVVTDAYIEDIETEILQRYCMLTFTYNLRNYLVKSKD
ncbi:MAG: TonB-dependent receptor [Bacteroidetes bacterium]|nr:TonB-dependent receptor [Bacteroidota bacterium]